MSKKKLGKKKLPYVMFATPCYDGKVDGVYAQSMAELAFFCGIYGIRFSMHTLGNGAFIELNRNVMVHKFLADKDYTHLFFIDADLKFPYDGALNLIKADRPVSAGVYRRRQEPEDYPANWMPHPDTKGPKGEDTLWVEESTWLKCSRVPTGFLCIRRDVVEDMVKDCKRVKVKGQPPLPWLFETGFDDQNRFVGEDFMFCDKYVAKYDRPIDVLPHLTFEHGGYKGTWVDYLDKQVKSYGTEKVRKLGERKSA